MSKVEWFRRTSWTNSDREEFNTRLKRSRGSSAKSQYLRIQAFHLAEAGHHASAIELLNRLFIEFPEPMELAQSHAQKANSLVKLGQIDEAILEYRAALQAERTFPHVVTNAWLDFGRLVVERQLTSIYDEVSQVFREFRDENSLKFPAIEYDYAAVQAILADARGENALSRKFAKQALAEAVKEHSGLRNHPTVGLVGSECCTLEHQLRSLANNMQEPHPYRRLFGMPMWFWVVLTIPLLVVGNLMPMWWRPAGHSEPAERATIFREMVLVAKEGDGYRVVSFGQHEAVKPLWSVNVMVESTSNVNFESLYFIPGLFVRKSTWKYELTSSRFDKGWDGDKVNPFQLSAKQMRELRPLVIEDLNKQKPGERLGDRLDQMLQHGLQATSYVCLQNVIIFLSYLSIVLAVVAMGFRFFTPPALTDLPPTR